MSSTVFQPGYIFAERYTIREAIADGGMAKIYRAWDEKEQRDVAIKKLYPYFMANEIVRQRFIGEGKIQQTLVHPNIVRVFEIVQRPMLAIVMELVLGETLDDYLAEKGTLEESEVLEMIIPILSAIGFAHKRGIIHRDIKPSNILILKNDYGFMPKIMDFGVAKIKGGSQNLTATGTTVGTLHYMSPEQIVGSKNIDGRADVYSLGVTLYKLFTGEVPFNAPTEFALMMAQVEASPLPPSQLRSNISPDIEKIILKAMAKKASDRFQTIAEFTNALLTAKYSTPSFTQNTITSRIPVEVLQFAIEADFVGQDRTSEINFQFEDVISAEVDTQELTQKIALSYPEETVEISSQDLLKVSSHDIKAPKVSPFYDDEENSMADTVALEAHVNLKSRARIVFDHSESRDLTAPKISQEAYDQVMGIVDHVADADTFEKPKLRTKSPGIYKTDRDISGVESLRVSKSFPKQENVESAPRKGSISIPTPISSGSYDSPSSFPRSQVDEATHPRRDSSVNGPHSPSESAANKSGFRQRVPSKMMKMIHSTSQLEGKEFDTKFVFMVAAALGIVVVAFMFLIFTILF